MFFEIRGRSLSISNERVIQDGVIRSWVCRRSNQHDGRLFPGTLLYCEGLHKPLLRGCLHLACTFALPLGMCHLVMAANNSILGSIAAIVYVGTNICYYGFSGMYHVGKWSAQEEIYLQIINHCGIAILGVGTFLPVSMLLLSLKIGFLFIASTLIACIWTCYHVRNVRPSSWRQNLFLVTPIPFIPFFLPLINGTEFCGALLAVLLQAAGLAVLSYRRPILWQATFGYHEMFHTLVMLASVCAYLVNWSIISRTCNPNVRHPNIIDFLHKTLFTYVT